MRMHHIGYAVTDIAKSIVEFNKLGFDVESEVFQDIDRKVALCFMRNGTNRIELVSPISNDSPVKNVLNKVGNTPYHICYISEDIAKDLKELATNKFIVIADIAPAIAFKGKSVAFLFKKDVGLIELVEE
ncbi:VOC family protein [Sporomusa aerivorans]|uniref:VOC family protein n=1 Tax=Sporomusa aerivorans TaxID=204936 RepID=UPI00352A69DC